ncbi:MAG: hypothetical protein GY782_06805 [Gammaproteobacteria bacterium]|nr:hypothetical protein [Gammaproteobacteria bacterium]
MRIKDILVKKKQEALMECGAVVDITPLLMMEEPKVDCEKCAKKCMFVYNGSLDTEIEVISND